MAHLILFGMIKKSTNYGGFHYAVFSCFPLFSLLGPTICLSALFPSTFERWRLLPSKEWELQISHLQNSPFCSCKRRSWSSFYVAITLWSLHFQTGDWTDDKKALPPFNRFWLLSEWDFVLLLLFQNILNLSHMQYVVVLAFGDETLSSTCLVKRHCRLPVSLPVYIWANRLPLA